MNWAAYKASRPDTPERRAAYAAAGRAIDLGAKVRALREAAGISQRALAERAGVTQPMIARMELGGVEPRVGTLARIGEALGHELVVDFRPCVPVKKEPAPTLHVPAPGRAERRLTGSTR